MCQKKTIIIACIVFFGVFVTAWLAPSILTLYFNLEKQKSEALHNLSNSYSYNGVTVTGYNAAGEQAFSADAKKAIEEVLIRKNITNPSVIRTGKYRVSSRLGSDAINSMRCLSRDDLSKPTEDIILNLSSHERCQKGSFRAENGALSGLLKCPGMDDIREHPEQISGVYGTDYIQINISYFIYGTNIPQTILYSRMGDC